jgi:thioredoxin-like negative regulator of GroEL
VTHPAASIEDLAGALLRAREAGRPAAVLLGEDGQTRRAAWSHIGVARLAKLGLLRRIATTAGHRLLERACAMEELTPAIERPGRPAVLRAEAGAPWIVAGCSARDGVVIEGAEVYWAGWRDQPPPLPQARFVPDFDADSLFAYLLRRLDRFPPESVERLGGGKSGASLDQLLSAYESQASLFVQSAVQNKRFHLACAAAEDPFPLLWMWGMHLMEEARKRPAAEADALLAEALDKLLRGYDPAKAYSSGFKEILTALRQRAKYRPDEEADAFFSQADQIAGAAAKHHKLDADRLSLWAETLAEWAARGAADAPEKLRRAVALYQEAVKLAPQNVHLRAHLAEALRASGRQSEAKAVFRKMSGAQAKGWMARYEMGLNCLKEARSQMSDPEAAMAEAAEHFEAALAGAPDRRAEILCDWGSALGDLARSRHGDTAERLFAACFTKLGAAAELNPRFHRPYRNWSGFLLHQAHQRLPESAAALRAEAREKCLKANQLKPGCSLYDLACIAAAEGDFAEVRARLEAALAAGTLPPAAHLETDADLAAVRVEPWFLDFVARLRVKPPR